MPDKDSDAIVIGSGPNGLSAACVLAKQGFRVLVLEANPRRPGGALGSEEATAHGFVHDVGAAFFPFGKSSPAWRYLELGRHVEWAHMKHESCHPAPDGTFACISRDLGAPDGLFGSIRDAGAWRKLAAWHRSVEPRMYALLLGAFPSLAPAFAFGPLNLLKLGLLFATTARTFAERRFETEAARRVVPGLGLHVDVGPDDRFGAATGYVLGLGATTGGYPVPVGGAQRISDALVRILEAHGGRVRLGSRVQRVVVSGGRAAAVVLDSGDEIRAGKCVLADTGAPSLLLDLLERSHVPSGAVRKMQRFPQGWGTFKMDWALTAPVPWAVAEARESAVVHAGDSVDDLANFTREVRAGKLPSNPYLVIGQQSLADSSRAPPGHHTLWAYTHVPSELEGGWDSHRESFADAVERRIEGLAPGFRARIHARRIVTPPDLEAMDANLVGGDIGGGTAAWHQQLVWRPVFPYFRYRMPVRGLYLCSSYAHPGGGVHGMCGFNAAMRAARDVG